MRLRLVIRLILFLLILTALVFGIIAVRSYIINQRPQASEYVDLSQQSIAQGDYEEAVRICDEGISAYPETEKLHELKAQACYLLGDRKKAAAAIEYGYKQTGSAELLALKDRYVMSNEADAEYLAADVNTRLPSASANTPGESVGGANSYTRRSPETFTQTTPPEVQLPNVTTTTTTTTTTTPPPETAPPEEQAEETQAAE